ncbi:MAG: hypothetical protein HY816_15540 [Candidatus Wallbacteria bacterium]|nr:hypothetical protein [Candidatus Wallbacteria bacterium]
MKSSRRVAVGPAGSKLLPALVNATEGVTSRGSSNLTVSVTGPDDRYSGPLENATLLTRAAMVSTTPEADAGDGCSLPAASRPPSTVAVYASPAGEVTQSTLTV